MYANLGPGLEVDLAAPSPSGTEVLYSHEYVAQRSRKTAASENNGAKRAFLNLYTYVDSNPVRYMDPSGLDRTLYFFGHAWIRVDEWDDNCVKIGTLQLEFGPYSYFKEGLDQYVVSPGGTGPYPECMGMTYKSTCQQDKELLAAWRALEDARREGGFWNSLLNYSGVNNCWTPICLLGTYGGTAGEVRNPKPPTEFYGPGTMMWSY